MIEIFKTVEDKLEFDKIEEGCWVAMTQKRGIGTSRKETGVDMQDLGLLLMMKSVRELRWKTIMYLWWTSLLSMNGIVILQFRSAFS